MHILSYRIVLSLYPVSSSFPVFAIAILAVSIANSSLPDRGANIDESTSEVVSLAELEKFTAFQSDVAGDPSHVILAVCRGKGCIMYEIFFVNLLVIIFCPVFVH